MLSFKLHKIRKSVKKLNSNDEISLSHDLNEIRKLVPDSVFFDALSDNDIKIKSHNLTKGDVLTVIDYIEGADLA